MGAHSEAWRQHTVTPPIRTKAAPDEAHRSLCPAQIAVGPSVLARTCKSRAVAAFPISLSTHYARDGHSSADHRRNTVTSLWLFRCLQDCCNLRMQSRGLHAQQGLLTRHRTSALQRIQMAMAARPSQ